MLRDSVYLTARATAMVCYLFIGSWTFSAVFAVLGGQQVVEQFFLSLNLSTTGFLVLTQVIIFLLGWPLEWTEIIIIFVPIFLPLLDDFKVDPIFFGILVALNTQTAFNTPPVAMAAFYLKGVAPPHVKLTDIFSRRAAVRVHGVRHHEPGLHLPAASRCGCRTTCTRRDERRAMRALDRHEPVRTDAEPSGRRHS